MSATIDDLRATLSANVRELPASSARTVAVHRRVRRIRRQRVGAGVTTLVLVAAASVLGVRVAQHRSDETAAQQLPEYADGGRLAVTMNIDTRVGTSVSEVVVPTSSSLILLTKDCGKGDIGDIGVTFLLAGKTVGGGTCGGSVTASVTADRPVRVEFRLQHGFGTGGRDITDAERRQLPRIQEHGGVYLPVPRSEYVFPSRPAHLLPVTLPDAGTGDIATSGADGTSTLHFIDVSQGLSVRTSTVAPGVVTILVDGHRLGAQPSWNYEQGEQDASWTAAELAAAGVTGSTADVSFVGSDFHEGPTDLTWSAAVAQAQS